MYAGIAPLAFTRFSVVLIILVERRSYYRQIAPMHPNRKKEQIDRLAKGIRFISNDFEKFGGIFIEALLEIPMNHQGINLLGYPVAGVVDSVSESGQVAVEFGDTSAYFSGTMVKARADLRKALRRQPSARHLFLLSGRPKKPRIAAAFVKRVRKWKGMVGKNLHLWGAEQIAAKIINDLMFNDVAIRRLAVYLPELKRIRDEEAVGRLAPAPDRDRIERGDIDREIGRRLKENPVLVLSGMSGLGKSDAAAAYAQRHEDEYNLVVWLERDEVTRIEKLHALPLERGGDTRNIAHLLKTGKCLLVIDDALPNIALQDLAALCGDESKVIVTRQRTESGSYQLPMLSREESEEILERTGEPCPPEVMAKIWMTVGGHPLALNLIAAAFREGSSWDDIVTECDAIGEFEDRGLLLSARLVGHLQPLLERELSVFVWAVQATCDQEFLVSQVTTAGLRKLRANAVTAADRGGVVRLHDVVFSAIKSGDWCPAERAQFLDRAFETYLIEAAEGDELRFWRTARVLRPKLERLVETGNRSPAFRYALLSTWQASETRPELVGDPLLEAKELKGVAPGPLAVIGVIEAIEQLYLYEKLAAPEAVKANLESRLPAFDLLGELPALSEREMIEIQHHKGKALKRLGKVEQAACLLETVAKGRILVNEARLQLMDIYRSSRKDRVEELADAILRQSPGECEMTYSVYLGAIERIGPAAGTWRARVISDHFDRIQDVILRTAESGLHQAYATFAALGRYLSKEMPDRFLTIFSAMPAPTLASLSTDTERFAWGEIYSEAGRLGGPDANVYFEKAQAFYEAEKTRDEFHRQRYAELRIDMGYPEEAEFLLRERSDLGESEWLQRLMARARLAQGDPADALTWIESALDRLQRDSFRSEFLELRYNIRVALNDLKAVEDLQAAVDASEKEMEKARLEALLAALKHQSRRL